MSATVLQNIFQEILKFYSFCKQDEALVNRRERKHVFFMKPDGSSEDLFEVAVSRTVLDYFTEVNITRLFKNLLNNRIFFIILKILRN